ncbi:TerD family protein [Actinoplanes sp. NBRC 101535]|uniref:TerD family protein n=1 Tax=Actinoplanes sp. NBRC 101535 TaxID=3032196 RepID=UPI0024A19955|nr:TerD family protein [Actinoplanes sp. NBRC 101535]GLY08289.1 hypothetical protein Acsp01_86680 [Actinoplanes sp. NBRC 101535]
MVTRWTPAHRADLGLTPTDLPAHTITVTNRTWHLLHQYLTASGARATDHLAGRDQYIPAQLANHWGAVLSATDPGDWLLVGRWNGHAVVTAGLTHATNAHGFADTHELTPLAGTPLHTWLQQTGLHLATTPTGLVITATPHQENRMSVNLSKGGKVDLTKQAGGTLAIARIGLGWDVRRTTGEPYDLDSSLIALGTDSMSVGADWFVFYNNPASPHGLIKHHGDNLTGAGQGDDEQILVNLDQLPAHIHELVVAVTIHEARARGGQNFGLVENAYIRILDEATGTELARYDLTEDTGQGVNSLVFGKLYRRGTSWSFRAIGDGFTEELACLVSAYQIR